MSTHSPRFEPVSNSPCAEIKSLREYLTLLFGWMKPSAASASDVQGRKQGKPRFSFIAIALILSVASAWSAVANAGLMGWDPHFYYSVIQDKTWAQIYPFEQSMFLVTIAARPWSFASYIFVVITISLFILLVAFRRLYYSPLDQAILILFFSCSFYGLHFMVAFQRQFFGIVFFVLAIAGGRGSVLARIASLFSHLYTFSLHIFWALGRLSSVAACMAALLVVSAMSYFGGDFFAEKSHYGTYGETNPMHLLVKQSLTVLIAIIILLTIEREKNVLRSSTWIYIALSIPVAFWPYYAGVFSRLDYFFFPMIVALWPRSVRRDRLIPCRVCIVGLTVAGFYLWMNANLACEVMSYCPL